VTVTYERARQVCTGDPTGVAWWQLPDSAADVVGFGGWAEPHYSGATAANPDPDAGQHGNDVSDGIPMVATAVDDASPAAGVVLLAGFACTPGSQIVIHGWAAHVS
jgi:hypothetical protein